MNNFSGSDVPFQAHHAGLLIDTCVRQIARVNAVRIAEDGLWRRWFYDRRRITAVALLELGLIVMSVRMMISTKCDVYFDFDFGTDSGRKDIAEHRE